jgi:hypothetical protein
MNMKAFTALALTSAGIQAQVALTQDGANNQVVQWNRNLLAIVRTPGAEPATIQSTRSFAMMHAAVYDAVNSIDTTHRPYLVQIERVSPDTSQAAAAASAAHEVLVALYPTFQTTLDTELQTSLAQIPDGPNKDGGVAVGQIVGDDIVALRSNDGSSLQATAPPFVFGTAPGDFQSSPPNFPKPQFTVWGQVRPFALQQPNQFRPGPPPTLIYTGAHSETPG